MTVTSKIGIVGPTQRGMSLGINEFSGYFGVAVISTMVGYLIFVNGPLPFPFVVSEIIAVVGPLTAFIFIS